MGDPHILAKGWSADQRGRVAPGARFVPNRSARIGTGAEPPRACELATRCELRQLAVRKTPAVRFIQNEFCLTPPAAQTPKLTLIEAANFRTLASQVNRNFAIPELKLTWSLPPCDPQLDDSAVHVWAASLAVPSEMIAAWTVVLSSDERLRAGRFRFASDRDRFIAAHGILHSILASYLNTDPAKVCFQYAPGGKPLLAGSLGWLHFNLAHSGDLALVAVSRCCPVGVDVEEIRPMNDGKDIAVRFFSQREARELEGLPLNQQEEGFFNLWTRKEACLKATGEGLSERINSVEVAFIPGLPARLVQFPGESDSYPPWTLAELRPATMYVGALAAPVAGLKLSCWRWPAN